MDEGRSASAVRQPSAIAGLLLPVERARLARGVDGRRIYAIGGLAGPPANNPLERISTAAMTRVLEWVVAETGDPLVGLDLGRTIRPQAFHALGHSLESSCHLRDFGTRITRYFRLVSSAATARFVADDEAVAIEFDLQDGVAIPAEDAILVFLVGFVRELSGGACVPNRIEQRRPVPPDGGARHRDALGCPVAFGRERVRICYDRSLLDGPFVGASAELAEHNDKVVVDYLAKLDRSDIEARVKALAIRSLPGGRVSKSAIAAQLHMSPRTLQHRLAQCNRTFNGLIDELRRDLAKAYLENPTSTVGEVSFLLGFSDASNFSRAFKRWTGLTPDRFRKSRGAPVAAPPR